ncbi:MAG: hypothetical protein IJX68_02995 [Rikenellaceae bacterium]|nr:hypothetical protein [Rikenellaceae bacterium]
MKRIVILIAMLLLCSTAMAQNQKPISKERRFSFSVGYKMGFEITSVDKSRITGNKYDVRDSSDEILYHFVSLDFNYAISPKWEVGLATGMNETNLGVAMLPIYANAQYFFNDRTRGWFVSGDLGTNINVGVPAFGLLTGVGGGYRLYIADKFKMDFSLGYMYTTAKDTPPNSGWTNRQSGFQLGVALVF